MDLWQCVDSCVPELQGLEVKCYGEQKAVCYWRQALVLVQVQGEPLVLVGSEHKLKF